MLIFLVVDTSYILLLTNEPEYYRVTAHVREHNPQLISSHFFFVLIRDQVKSLTLSNLDEHKINVSQYCCLIYTNAINQPWFQPHKLFYICTQCLSVFQ